MSLHATELTSPVPSTPTKSPLKRPAQKAKLLSATPVSRQDDSSSADSDPNFVHDQPSTHVDVTSSRPRSSSSVESQVVFTESVPQSSSSEAASQKVHGIPYLRRPDGSASVVSSVSFLRNTSEDADSVASFAAVGSQSTEASATDFGHNSAPESQVDLRGPDKGKGREIAEHMFVADPEDGDDEDNGQSDIDGNAMDDDDSEDDDLLQDPYAVASIFSSSSDSIKSNRSLHPLDLSAPSIVPMSVNQDIFHPDHTFEFTHSAPAASGPLQMNRGIAPRVPKSGHDRTLARRRRGRRP